MNTSTQTISFTIPSSDLSFARSLARKMGWATVSSKKSMHKRCESEVMPSTERDRLIEKLSQIALLKDGWGGENSYAIEKLSIKNTRKLIKSRMDEELKGWKLFPDTNGTLYLQHRTPSCSIGISIGNEEFSYFIDADGCEMIGEKMPFNMRSFNLAWKEMTKHYE